MDSSLTWAEALKINPEKLSEWTTAAPADVPLLVWCLENGHVNVEEYLEWACQHHGLPVLNTAFFARTFDRASLEPHRQNKAWSAWCFPVAQWDDVTLVACTEPPAATSLEKYAYVLADPSAMREAWGVSATATPVDAPEGINPNAGSTFVLNLDSASLMDEHSEVVDPHIIEKSETTGLTLSVVVDSPKAKSAPSMAPPPAPQPAAKKASPTLTVAQPPPVKTAKTASIASVNEETEIRAAFERLHQDYQSALIMRCSDNVAKPYKWDESLAIKAGDEKRNFNLGFPSFFRIVAKTMQPYHGYVIDSPVHKEFFESMGFSSPPACVTAIPLKSGDNLWGILVAFGGEAAQTTDALNHAVTVVEKLSGVLEPAWSRAA